MKGRPVDQLVYECMFPKPRATDPPNFQALLQRHLILEVRQEVHSFYGHLETQEAKYPGLDYCHTTHRIRLSRWQWHRRLFRAFDALRLTPAEIARLTKWEGTRWAKERFEREQGIRIRDTTADDFPDWVEPQDRPSPPLAPGRQATRGNAASSADLQAAAAADAAIANLQAAADAAAAAAAAADANMPDDSDEELESVGVALNERLRERVALRSAGDMTTPLDEEWEQWLKNAIESGELPHMADQIARFSSPHSNISPDDIFPPRMLTAARDGQWHEIPDFFHDMIRRSLEREQRRNQEVIAGAAAAAAAAAAPSSSSSSASRIAAAQQSSGPPATSARSRHAPDEADSWMLGSGFSAS